MRFVQYMNLILWRSILDFEVEPKIFLYYPEFTWIAGIHHLNILHIALRNPKIWTISLHQCHLLISNTNQVKVLS
jgi:hypothetical protein